MTLSSNVQVLEEGARLGVVFKNAPPPPDIWMDIAYELEALPSGARWQLEYLGYQIVLVMGPCSDVAGISVPPTVKGFTAYGKCVVSVPAAYPNPTTTSRVVLHEPGHALDINTSDPLWPYSRQGDWLAINDVHGWGDPGESWPEQLGHWCLYEKYGTVGTAADVLAYFRGKATSRGWYVNGTLYW